jgi:hypothetical protein
MLLPIRRYGAVNGKLGLAGFMALMKDNMLLPVQHPTPTVIPMLLAFFCLAALLCCRYGAVNSKLGLAGFMALMKDNMLFPNQIIWYM